MNRPVRLALSILVLPVLAGCETTYDRPEFGEAVRRNIEAQLVNPGAPGEAGPATFDGDRAGLAIGRYKADAVEEPEELGTTTVGGGE